MLNSIFSCGCIKEKCPFLIQNSRTRSQKGVYTWAESLKAEKVEEA